MLAKLDELLAWFAELLAWLAEVLALLELLFAKLELLAAGLHGLVSLRIHKKGANWAQPIDGTVDALIRAIFRP